MLRLLPLLLLLLAAPAAAAETEYYLVKPGETVASIEATRGLEPGTVVYMNKPVMGEKTEVEEGMILQLPALPKPAKRKPQPKKTKATAARPPTGTGLMVVNGRTVQASSNRYVSPDGRVTHVPAYVPPVDPEEEARRSMASRDGRPIRALLATARRFLGVPYVWGGEQPGGFDCSGYVMYVYRMHGVVLPRTADIQFTAGRAVPRGKEEPGDLVFFETYAPGASHVGIYLGLGQFIHASSAGFVRISSLSEEFFQARYLGARRVF